MISIRRSGDRGRARFSWLDSHHTFSFGHYHDPQHMGFGPLRVINEDRVKPAAGFATHGHRDMEIISYVLDGALEHRDSIGNGSIIRPGEVQRMTAGSGIQHSEFNHSPDDEVHFLQIWIQPAQAGLDPGYEQKAFDDEEKHNRLRIVVSADGRDGSLTIHQDASLSIASLDPSAALRYPVQKDRAAWVQIARGAAIVNDLALEQGDGAAVSEVDEVAITATGNGAEILLFDLPSISAPVS